MQSVRLIKDNSISHLGGKHLDLDQKSIIEEEEPATPTQYQGATDRSNLM